MGIYLSAMSLCLLGSLRIDFLSLLILPLVCALPVVLYRLMRAVFDAEPSCRRVSSLWLMGIYTFIFGSLICALVSDVYILTVEPGFVKDYIMRAIHDMEAQPDSAMFSSQIELMHRAVESRALPGCLQFIASMAWSTCFFGSLLSLFMAWLLMARSSYRRGRQRI